MNKITLPTPSQEEMSLFLKAQYPLLLPSDIQVLNCVIAWYKAVYIAPLFHNALEVTGSVDSDGIPTIGFAGDDLNSYEDTHTALLINIQPIKEKPVKEETAEDLIQQLLDAEEDSIDFLNHDLYRVLHKMRAFMDQDT